MSYSGPPPRMTSFELANKTLRWAASSLTTVARYSRSPTVTRTFSYSEWLEQPAKASAIEATTAPRIELDDSIPTLLFGSVPD